MEDVVGIKANDRTGRIVAFMTWGRLFDSVAEAELLRVVQDKSASFEFGPMSDFALCRSLSEVANHEYFFEALLYFAQRPIPFGERYEAWRIETKRRLSENGEGLYFLGHA